jgi:hypothetical protein
VLTRPLFPDIVMPSDMTVVDIVVSTSLCAFSSLPEDIIHVSTRLSEVSIPICSLRRVDTKSHHSPVETSSPVPCSHHTPVPFLSCHVQCPNPTQYSCVILSVDPVSGIQNFLVTTSRRYLPVKLPTLVPLVFTEITPVN